MDMASCVESKGLYVCKQMCLYADVADLAEQVVTLVFERCLSTIGQSYRVQRVPGCVKLQALKLFTGCRCLATSQEAKTCLNERLRRTPRGSTWTRCTNTQGVSASMKRYPQGRD